MALWERQVDDATGQITYLPDVTQLPYFTGVTYIPNTDDPTVGALVIRASNVPQALIEASMTDVADTQPQPQT